MLIEDLRRQYHIKLNEQIIRIRKIQGCDCPNFADIANRSSRTISAGLINLLGLPMTFDEHIKEQM
jgi:hypothetical protein